MKINRSLLCIASALILATIGQAEDPKRPVRMVGVWRVEASTDDGVRQLTWTFSNKDGELDGVSRDHEDGTERTFESILVSKGKVLLKIGIENGDRKGVIRVEGVEKSPGILVGTWSIDGDDGTKYADGEIRAKRDISLAGEWEADAEMPDGASNKSALTLSGSNSALQGTLVGSLGKVELEKVKFDGEKLGMEFEFPANGNALEVFIEVKPVGHDSLVGEWKAIRDDGTTAAEGKWSAKRKVEFVGKWDVVASVPDNANYNGTLTLTKKNGEYTGTSQSDGGEPRALSSAKVTGKSVVLSLPVQIQGNSGTITIEAELQDDGSLQGEWVLSGGDDNTEYVREVWKATRR